MVSAASFSARDESSSPLAEMIYIAGREVDNYHHTHVGVVCTVKYSD